MTRDVRLEFASEVWRARFEAAGLSDFEAIWSLEADTVEPANVRRGGWSAVVRFATPDGAGFYLKRQQDHDFRDWRHLKPQPTVVREWEMGRAFRSFGIGTAEPICLGIDQSDHSRGLLVTAALDQHHPLPDILCDRELGRDDRRALWHALADEVRQIHDHGYRHNCLYGQHVLVRQEAGDWQCCFIDLEKANRTRRKVRAIIADLSALDRHTDDMSTRDRQWFWDRYFRDVSLPERRKILRTLARRTAERGVDHYIRDCREGRRGEEARGSS